MPCNAGTPCCRRWMAKARMGQKAEARDWAIGIPVAVAAGCPPRGNASEPLSAMPRKPATAGFYFHTTFIINVRYGKTHHLANANFCGEAS